MQRFTVLSFFFHLSFFLAVFLVVKQSGRFVMPSPYVVSLVGSEGKSEGRPAENKAAQAMEKATPPAPPKESVTQARKPKAVNKTEERYVSEQVAALQAKKKIEKLVNLRNVISLKGSGEGKPGAAEGVAGRERGTPLDDYYAKVTKAIWQQWAFPETSGKDLEAIISIRILKDGSLQVTRIEKSSGNGLFDRSALRAITKANPVPPPPHEMEIGVRFYP